MRRAIVTRVVVIVSIAVWLSGSLAGQSPQKKPPAKKPAAKSESAPKPAAPAATDIRIRTRFTTGAQVSENTTYLKGVRQRVEFPGIVSIEQRDLGRTLLVNPASKSYMTKAAEPPTPSTVQPSDVSPAPVQSAATKGRNAAASQQKGGVITYITTLTDTGERKQMFGRDARHITTTIARQPGATACDKTAGTVEVDGWYIDLPAADRGAAARSQPASDQPVTAGACVDRVESQTRGDAKLGFPLAMTTTTTKIGEGDKPDVSSSTLEVTAFEMTTLDAALFDVPAGYTEAKSTAELMSGSASGGDLAEALLGSTADGTGSAAPKKPGAIRIGVLEPVDKSSHNLPTRDLRQELAADFHKAPYEALTLRGSSPGDAQADAARMQCDYILATTIGDIKTSKPGKVGGLLKKVSHDGPPPDVHQVDLEYRLYPVSAAAGAPAVSDSVRTTSGGGFDIHSALHAAMFAGSMYMRFSGLGMLSGSLMGNLGGGLGPLAGAGLVDPRMSALSSMTQVFMSSAGPGGSQTAASPTGTSGSAPDAGAVIRQTVGAALSNAAKGTIDHLQRK